jgi:hypothetical protein
MTDHRDFELARLKRELERKNERLEKYKKASKAVGLDYEDWDVEATAKAIKHVRSRGSDGVLKELLRQYSILDGIQVEMKDAIEELRVMKEKERKAI